MALNIEKKVSDAPACVCFICIEGRIGGAEKSLLLLGELVKQQYPIIAICPTGSEVERHFGLMGIKSLKI
ncbi:MAG TPA: hypothetical protein PLP05_01870, partial [Sedimentisphaerales bacterium]|nr:hypothetical protein [Sedimentisphaerales bacterium]